MSPNRLERLLKLAGPLISRRDTRFRVAIPAEERNFATLRFLATGDSRQSLPYSFHIGKSTISNIISQTSSVRHEALCGTYITSPKTE